MIIYKSTEEIGKIRKAGKILQEIFEKIAESLQPGMTTKDLDKLAHDIILARGARPSFLNYGNPPFPASICASVNEEVVHGIPSADRLLYEGDIISIDVGACLDGFHADAARTFSVGEIDSATAKLVQVTKECFFKGFEAFKEGNRISDVSAAVQNHAEAHGYGIVRELTGHGIGRDLHEDPDVPNYVLPFRGPKIREGLVIALEPMINMGTEKILLKDDGWTIVAADLKPSAHYENTIAIGVNGPEILTEDLV